MTRKVVKPSSDLLPDISGVSLELCHVRATTILRVTRRPGAELCLDPAKATGAARYDDFRRPARYAVTYAADDLLASVAEARMLRSGPSGSIIISEQHFEQASLVRYEADRELVMLALTGSNVVRLGAADFMWQAGYDGCQRFAAAVHETRLDIDGIAYTSRKFPPYTCYAIFDRAVRGANLRATDALQLASLLQAHVDSGAITVNPSDPGGDT